MLNHNMYTRHVNYNYTEIFQQMFENKIEKVMTWLKDNTFFSNNLQWFSQLQSNVDDWSCASVGMEGMNRIQKLLNQVVVSTAGATTYHVAAFVYQRFLWLIITQLHKKFISGRI